MRCSSMRVYDEGLRSWLRRCVIHTDGVGAWAWQPTPVMTDTTVRGTCFLWLKRHELHALLRLQRRSFPWWYRYHWFG